MPSNNDCFSMLMSDVDFSTPAQPYDPADPSDITQDYMLGMPHSHSGNHEMPYYSDSLAADGSASAQHDLPFRSGPSSLPPSYSLPYEQLVQELSHTPMQTMPQQQEGITLALQLMGQLCCLEQRPAYANLSPLEREHWINTLADKCRKVTSTVSDMLNCHSSKDGYFLTVVCLVMSKVLDAYVQAAQALSARGLGDRRLSHSSSSSSTVSVMSTTESETSYASTSRSAREGDAKAIQQLLDELYQVRASMDLLGTKVASMPSSYDSLATAVPFSPDVLNKLYDEQRRRLKTISLQLINSLKAFWVEEHSF
ncbi:uncharacterized protein SETTUDRAFT_156996 [Exserohilum turcica Et28A]|uniref:Aflatoxin regulatory protein domain-containing protein n=1 Tax=Exserohilum turcicum (strain 28A) TaxID=671987 RepID=R0K180_EXST2|nr:uncharacterized protein SETTUDRAFT_156996 [Exserohilum turcica Et28A]EOA82147.1 hypothetical protein SETTUDRAFT_156996 [Exserohilum turcica Et28A]